MLPPLGDKLLNQNCLPKSGSDWFFGTMLAKIAFCKTKIQWVGLKFNKF